MMMTALQNKNRCIPYFHILVIIIAFVVTKLVCVHPLSIHDPILSDIFSKEVNSLARVRTVEMRKVGT